MPSQHHHHHRSFLLYSMAGAIGIAYYYWKNQNKRKDGDANVLYSDSQWESLLMHYNQMATPPATGKQPNKTDCIYLDYNGTTPIYPPVLAAMLVSKK